MDQLKTILSRIDGRGYKAYKDIQGRYDFQRFRLFVDYVQGDPFASPSRIRVQIPQSIARYPEEWFKEPHRRVALEDWICRVWAQKTRRFSGGSGTGKSGLIAVDIPGQEILSRTAVVVNRRFVEVRITVGLPARGRQVLGQKAIEMLCRHLPQLVEEGIPIQQLDTQAIEKRMCLVDNQQAIRKKLAKEGWISFVADGAILPRESGISDRPLKTASVVPFYAPESMATTIEVPHGKPLRGMVVSRGITLIVGGGFHGKSTLLQALERGVYDHIAEDGREYVLTIDTALKVRSEDGRRVEKVNISPFINNLPFGKDTLRFSTEDASGSTSQATNIIEGIEAGANALLIDEDTSATNFMIRDRRMQQLVAKGKEPITPFIDKVRQLYEEKGISSILVLGGSGDYFDVADSVMMMDEYQVVDVTDKAKRIAQENVMERVVEGGDSFGEGSKRIPLAKGFDPSKGRKEKVDAKGLKTIFFGNSSLDLSGLEQLVDPSQTRSLAELLRMMSKRVDGEKNLVMLLDELYKEIDEKGLDILSPFQGHPGDFALPRKLEVAGAINRLRTLWVK
ncbi:ABC-ATPase domain-containing protein [Marininema halotolerans]|uniref:Predicted ATPase of the ABC class n=1 Tax=Marininema halotolerans TaxID=1155944 RepID=A0A1I6T143_9BACL|nr:ABC-ATPase domain-containing protein [Marininema halotolerans]SFS82866.1 Predicted ATPase of the ABC class [Marininema halotolerans]